MFCTFFVYFIRVLFFFFMLYVHFWPVSSVLEASFNFLIFFFFWLSIHIEVLYENLIIKVLVYIACQLTAINWVLQ